MKGRAIAIAAALLVYLLLGIGFHRGYASCLQVRSPEANPDAGAALQVMVWPVLLAGQAVGGVRCEPGVTGTSPPG